MLRLERARPLEERKAKLAKLLSRTQDGIYFNEHLEGDGAIIFDHAMPNRSRGHRIKAPRSVLSLGPVEMLAEDQESCEPGDAEDRGWDIRKSQNYPRWIIGPGAKQPHRFC
jgi:hypothetical protein